jgi:hypothetical protein
MTYIIFQDPNVLEYIELRLKLFRIDIIKQYMKFKMKRQLDKDFKDIQKTLNEWRKENGESKM